MTRSKQIYTGAFALMVAGLFSKVISAFYRIPLQNLTGDVGFYMYQQLYPILGIAAMFALYGFPSAISKYLAEWPAAKHQQIYRRILFVMIGFSLLLTMLFLVVSPVLALFMGDQQLAGPLRNAAWVFLAVPFVALFRGVTQADQWMEPTAYSQMVEQFIRAFVIIGTAILIFNHQLDVSQIANGATMAAGAGLLTAFLFLWPFYLRHIRLQKGIAPVPQPTIRFLFRSIVLSGVVISLNHMLLLLMQLADAFTIVPALSAYGESLAEAREIKGIFDRGQPLVQLVTVLGSSLALALVPQVTALSWQMDRQGTLIKMRTTIKYCILLSVGATVGLIILFPEVNQLFFQNQSGTATLRVLALAILFSSLAVTLASVLQGFGYIRWTAFILLGGLVIKLGLNYFLVAKLGIIGAAIATVVTLACIASAYYRLLSSRMKLAHLFPMPWRQMLLASGAMAVVLSILKWVMPSFEGRLSLLLYVLGCVLAGLMIYGIVIIKTGALDEKERKRLSLRRKQ
ncbi:putative polysaccharide biosynthesis protein [Gracilibacillus alcaliphilus]|uniref:putative polysaccharide biosynthesis protein n=1 Tax=Gracilibacillus alcaliphilus TaxID=1401441 RepID=UPI0019568D82|nr:polysaccharide biosynthesis protein [Gracilibacillus alcaliphilus]MBM7678138.1 PST family polysaccharide transporter [Gracilibacillus alcaliphilus]